MEGFLTFLADNYLVFLLVAIIIIFALIGYLFDGKNKKESDASESPKVAPTFESKEKEIVSPLEQKEVVVVKEAPEAISEEPKTEENIATSNSVGELKGDLLGSIPTMPAPEPEAKAAPAEDDLSNLNG